MWGLPTNSFAYWTTTFGRPRQQGRSRREFHRSALPSRTNPSADASPTRAPGGA
jgi:hypothetical protein